MFPSYISARRLFNATMIISLVGTLGVSAMAATPLKAVSIEAIGDARALDDSARPSSGTLIHMSFALNTIDKTDLKAYADGVTDPKSPYYHEWLKPDEIGKMFGASDVDINSITNYLKSEGFTSINVWSNRMFISASAPRDVVEKRFNVEIHGYDRDKAHIQRGYSKTYYAPDRQPTIDSTIASKLEGIFGLSNKVQRIPTLRKVSGSAPQLANDGSLLPADLAVIYGGSKLHTAGYEGKGETIAIFSPTAFTASDVTTFETDENITGATVNIINVDGGTTDATDATEACLDIETIIGQAPASTVDVYEGPNDGSFDIFNAVETADPDILSESYGLPEDEVDITYATSYETIREAMAAEGISIFVSSGDSGAFLDSTLPTTPVVSIDTSSAYVTSVGGTELLPFVNTNQWNGEIAWTYKDGSTAGDSGSSGGLSIYYPKPSWQVGTGVNNTYSNGMRQVPDIAACASFPYYEIYTDGGFAQIGGTSASCPLWASSIALIEESLGYRLGNIDPLLYSVAADAPTAYHDITSGNDGYYFCTAGWDYVTGWGSADFSVLASSLAPTVYTYPAGLQMISVPYTFAVSDTVGEVLSGLVTSTGSPTDVVAAWVPADENYVVSPTYPATYPVPGQGYWARFQSPAGGTLSGLGTEITTPYYGVALQPGWNMVGDPFITPVAIDNIQIADATGTHTFAAAVSAGSLSPYLYSYVTGTGYVPNTAGGTLTPYLGYWVYVTESMELTFYTN